ncbi:MAG: hypothetical protein FP814_12220 [Desulfobacterium sp.]|nr:hypothetical protein [Desulfobacterium sp.]
MINIIQNTQLFDFKDSNGNNVMQKWADKMPMQPRERGRLDSKIDLLKRVETNLPPGLFHPTKCRHIMHLVINGQVTLRPMLCRGPFATQGEFTFLCGATEKDRKYIPRDAPERAEVNRTDLKLHPEKRCQHERFNKFPETSIQ